MNTGEGPSLIWGMESSSNYFDRIADSAVPRPFFHASDENGANSARISYSVRIFGTATFT